MPANWYKDRNTSLGEDNKYCKQPINRGWFIQSQTRFTTEYRKSPVNDIQGVYRNIIMLLPQTHQNSSRKTKRSVSSQLHIQTPRSGLTKHSRGFKDQRWGVQISHKTLIKEFDIAFQMNHTSEYSILSRFLNIEKHQTPKLVISNFIYSFSEIRLI